MLASQRQANIGSNADYIANRTPTKKFSKLFMANGQKGHMA